MKKLDKIISALYLAKSDNRERMLSDLIINVLYAVNEPTDCHDIIGFIKENFYLNPIEYEVKESLESLVENNELVIQNGMYLLSEKSQASVHSSLVRGQSDSQKRFQTFTEIVMEIHNDKISSEDIKKLWTVFNEYLLECFMVFGRKAIDIFLPYKTEELSPEDDILKLAYTKLNDDNLLKVFKKVVLEYPKRLNEPELRFLTGLASRAEKFYSLGIEKEDYEKIKNLEIKDLIVLVDTNILYSILDLNTHPENAAILELIRVAKEKHIDLRIVYLPKTYKEFQKVRAYLDTTIPKENFRPGQINALLQSEKLDQFSKKYYEEKLKNSSVPHPSEKVYYAQDFLKGKGIEIYNSKFPNLDEEEKYLNSKIAEYLEFEHYYNNLCDEKGYGFHLKKDDPKIEHDIYLREAIKILKTKFSGQESLHFICLSLDRSLIHFDHYTLRNENLGVHRIINPNFILPSIFIKKIRAFIPISTNDYRKAFISSLTAPSLQKETNDDNYLLQKSMTYFKSLGIEDEEIILNCIKRELFFENFQKSQSTNTSEEFIQTEIAIEISKLKKEKELLSENILSEQNKSELIIKQKDEEREVIVSQKKQLEEQLLKEKKISRKNKEGKISIEKEKNNIIDEKDSIIDDLVSRLNIIEQKASEQEELLIRENSIHDWENRLNNYILEQWANEIIKFRKSAIYAIVVLFLTLLPIVVGFILKTNEHIINSIEEFGINQWYVWGLLAVIFVVELFGRSYIFNKERVKNGWNWCIAFFKKSKYKLIMEDKKKESIKKFIEINGDKLKI